MGLELGPYRNRVNARLKQWDAIDVIGRLKGKDLTLWREGDRTTDMLGWLSLGRSMNAQLDDMLDVARQACSDGITEAVLLGMGGSSMAPCVFQRTFGSAEGHPKLTVLDSTHPDEVRAVRDRIDPGTTLFIVSSKSGGTMETMSMCRYFWEEMRSAVTDAGRHFIAITDPGTSLAHLASEKDFRHTFEANPDVGGRYSALTAFGLFPAALLGIDVRSLLRDAFDAWETGFDSASEHDGLVMGAALGELTAAGRDKATIVTSNSLRSFPAWAEQLFAESTGKDGKGIIPVVGEPWLQPDEYGNDRTFIGLSLDGEESAMTERMRELSEAGHPTIHMVLEDKIELGRAMFEWELATATAAIVMGIDPFDQPDVQATKELTREMMSGGRSYEGRGRGVETLYLDEPDELRSAAAGWLANAEQGDYAAIQAYLGYGDDIRDELRRLQGDLLSSSGLPTTMGYGPRFLHSTGQLHKGGPNTGLFLQIVDSSMDDVQIPGTEHSFGELTNAEALGDYVVLRDRGRRVLRIDLDGQGAEGIARIRDLLNVMFQTGAVRIMA